jgi:hypothetical protein
MPGFTPGIHGYFPDQAKFTDDHARSTRPSNFGFSEISLDGQVKSAV